MYNPGNNVIVNFIMRFPKIATATAIIGVTTPVVVEKIAEKPTHPPVVEQPAQPAPPPPVTVKEPLR